MVFAQRLLTLQEKAPKSFVIKSGNVTKSISQLVKDMRELMEPNTATRLRVSSSPLGTACAVA